MRARVIGFLLTGLSLSPLANSAELLDSISDNVDAVYDQVVNWRRDIHQYPELGNREFRTSALVADHLRSLGMDVHTNVAHTGVVGVLQGGQPGPAVALRADMDALPVTEQTGLPFASAVSTTYKGEKVGVMHACGHDAHTAMLLGAATVLANMRDQLSGKVMFIFQPAEEGPPPGEKGGAELMLAEGVFDIVRPEAVFALHVSPDPSGSIKVRGGITSAGASSFSMIVKGRQTHGALPWHGVDPITLSGEITTVWQTISSRYIDTTIAPSPVVTVGRIRGGSRHNIIPDRVEMAGTVRYFSEGQRDQVFSLMKGMAKGIAEPVGGAIEMSVDHGYIPVVNDPALVKKVSPLLSWASDGKVSEAPLATGAEDFAFFAREVPGLIFILGSAPANGEETTPNHSPLFTIDESAMRVGVRALVALTLDVGSPIKNP